MLRVLVVDAEAWTRAVCRLYFSHEPGRRAFLREETDGREAIWALKEDAFDLVLCEERLRPTTGVDVLAAAWWQQPHAVRVLMMGFGDLAVMAGARRRAAVNAFLEKPLSEDAFHRALDHALDEAGLSA